MSEEGFDSLNQDSTSKSKQSKKSLKKYDVILIGDSYTGKSSYLKILANSERKNSVPVEISPDENQYDFLVENSATKAIFSVKDTANQEKFKSLTQSHYRKAQCALLAFSFNNEDSFFNLDKWYNDALNYNKIQDSKLSIILIGLKNREFNSKSLFINDDLIEKFISEHNYVLDYCEIDLRNEKNLKLPFQILIDRFTYANEKTNNQDQDKLSYFKNRSKSAFPTNEQRKSEKRLSVFQNPNFNASDFKKSLKSDERLKFPEEEDIGDNDQIDISSTTYNYGTSSESQSDSFEKPKKQCCCSII